jgi:hypothetical protein
MRDGSPDALASDRVWGGDMESQEALVGVPAAALAVSERMENLANDKSPWLQAKGGGKRDSGLEVAGNLANDG